MTNAEPINDDLRQDILAFLDDLREEGITNMFGAGQFISDEYGLSRREAGMELSNWMKTYGDRHPQ